MRQRGKIRQRKAERQAADDSIIRDMRFACWLTKATDTHSEYAVLTAFPQQQWLRERASMLRIHTLSQLFLLNTLRTGLLNCLNARSRGLTFRHRASCI